MGHQGGRPTGSTHLATKSIFMCKQLCTVLQNSHQSLLELPTGSTKTDDKCKNLPYKMELPAGLGSLEWMISIYFLSNDDLSLLHHNDMTRLSKAKLQSRAYSKSKLVNLRPITIWETLTDAYVQVCPIHKGSCIRLITLHTNKLDR